MCLHICNDGNFTTCQRLTNTSGQRSYQELYVKAILSTEINLHMIYLCLALRQKLFQGGNGASVIIFFIISIIITILDHRLEIYTVLSEINDNVEFVLVVKIFVELEAELSTRKLKLKLSNGSTPVFLYTKKWSNKRKGGFWKLKPQFLDKISGLCKIKLLGLDTYDTFTMKVNMKQSIIFRSHQWFHQNHSFRPQQSSSNFRYQHIRILQNSARCFATNFE